MKRTFYRAEHVRAAAANHWASILSRLGVATESLTGAHTKCPGCGGKDRFRFDDQEGAGTFLCSQGGGGILAGDGIDLLAHVRNCDWKEACNAIGELVCPEKAIECGSGLPREQVPAVPQVADEPKDAPVTKAIPFDLEALKRFYRPDVQSDVDWFARRSRVPLQGVSPGSFLEAIFVPGEKVLVFTNERSQGQFIHWVGKGSYRVGQVPGVKAVSSILPRGDRDGVWFLCQPIDGLWHPNPRAAREKNGELRLSRRSMESVTAWRYMVLESDEAPEPLWLNLLAQLPLPIVAIYRSGRRSVHALVRVRADSKAEWDAVKDTLCPLLSKLGADPGALSAVRLTRLPGCYRGDRLQQLLFLNPSPEPGLPICSLLEV